MRQPNKLIICGTGEIAELSFFYFKQIAGFDVVGFCQEQDYIKTDKINGLPLIALEELPLYFSPENALIFVAIGYKKLNRLRRDLLEKLKALGYTPASFVHPTAVVYSSSNLGEHVFVLEHVVIQPFSFLGDNSFVWSAATICHHCFIGSDVFIGSGVVVGGGARIGESSFIGMNAVIRDHIVVGKSNLIGANAVVTQDTEDFYILAPAKGRKISNFPPNFSLI